MIEKFSTQQKEILRFAFEDQYSYLICDGAVRSGKTSVMALAFVIWLMDNFDGVNAAICAKTVSNAERNIITPLLSAGALPYSMKYHRADRALTVTMGDRENRVYLFGGKDESSYQLIQGITLAGVFLDEVALMPRSFVEQALARTLTYADRKIWFSCNPENNLHWFNQEWIKPTDAGDRADAKHLHFLMSDNPILTQNEIDAAAAMFSGVFYQRYILGLWVSAEGLIYDMFSYNRHTVTGTPDTEGDYFVSADFGIQNATVWLLWQRMAGGGAWICLREWYYSGRAERLQKTVGQLVDGLADMLSGVVPRQVIVDPSAAALIAELRRRRFHVVPAVNDVLDGISDVATLLNQDRILFHDSCKNTLQEFGVYCWDAKAAQHGEDRPIKENDHAMDAVRYFVRTRRLAKRI